jgi:hypothetical protein
MPAHVAQVAEHFLGKEKVPGSNPGVGSTILLSPDFVFISRLLEGDGRVGVRALSKGETL